MVRQHGGRGKQALLEEPLLVLAHLLVELLAPLVVDGGVADVEDAFAQEVHHLVVHLEV